MWNADLRVVFPDWQVGDINQLERRFCELMKYRFHINTSTYAKYYFGLNGMSSEALNHGAMQVMLQLNPNQLLRRVDPDNVVRLVQQRSREYESRHDPRQSPEKTHERLLAQLAVARKATTPRGGGGRRIQRSLSI